jgi:HK97 family phage prohead protease
MPYSGPSDPNLPANILKLSTVRRRQWLHVYNSARDKGHSDGDAIHMANGVVNDSSKGANSATTIDNAFLDFVEKDSKGMSDKETKIAEFAEFEIKSEGEDAGIVEGYASVFGFRDHSKDQVMTGAFTKTLLEREKKVVYIPSHDYGVHIKDIPAVPLSIREDAKGLHTVTKFILGTQAGKESFEVLKQYQKAGRPLGMSFTFKADDFENTKDGRNLKAVSLFEYGHTALPMHDMARTTNVKSDSQYETYAKYIELKKQYTKEQLDEMVKNGESRTDSSYPIKDVEDLTEVVKFVTDIGTDDKNHIIKRAKALNKIDVLPNDWNVTSIITNINAAKFEALTEEVEEKIGRKLSEANSTRIKQALETLQQLLEQPDEKEDDTSKSRRDIDALLAKITL